MAWDTYTAFTQDTGVSDGAWVTLGDISGATPGEVFDVVIGADNESGTVTDALQVRVLVAIDDTPTNYTNDPIFAISYLPSAVTQEWFGFTLSGWEDYRIQTKSAGSTDDYTVDGKFKGDGVSL